MPATETGKTRVELPVEGMTCASCANRIERKLNKLDGVEASVNFALEQAAVDYDAELVEPEQLLAAVEAAGYSASLPATPGTDSAVGDDTADSSADSALETLRRRLLVSALLSLPILAMSMIPPLQFDS